MKCGLCISLKFALLTISLAALCAGVPLRGDPKADAEAQIKQLTEKYRAAGLPDALIQPMIQMERERLFPAERAAGEAQRAIEGRKRAQAFNEPEDDEDEKSNDTVTADANAPSAERAVSNTIPALNRSVVHAIPGEFASEAALLAYLRVLVVKAEAALGAKRLAEAAAHLGKGRETGYAGLALWINHEVDLGIYLMLKASVEQPADLMLLNNFAACLSMSGVPEKAVPLLNYLEKRIPDRSTVLNNLGQAWLGLGDTRKASGFLERAVAIDEHQPEAQRSLARLSEQSGDSTKAAAHLEKAMSGGFDPAIFFDWRRLAPGRDVAPSLRANYARHYREVPITKRWQLPDVPADIATAQLQEASIEQFFANLSATQADLSSRMAAMQDTAFQTQAAQFQRMRRQSVHLDSLGDVNEFKAQYGPLFHPLKFKAQIMLNALRSTDYATSYEQRIAGAASARREALNAFEDSIRPLHRQISALHRQVGKMEGGEGDDEVKIEALEKQACALRAQIQQAQISSLAYINTTYIKAVEAIANQRLQELSFWTALYDLPNDTAPGLYTLYGQYLDELGRMKSLYPLPAPLRVFCEGDRDSHQTAKVTGRMQLWEDSHCPISLDVDVVVAHARWNCREVSIGGKLSGIAVNWDRKLDPVTWEVVAHSLSVAGGVKEFEEKLTDRLTGRIGLDGKVTIKLDADLMPTDLVVRAEAGAELRGPDRGKVSADLGALEISVQAGFRGEGPVPQLVSAMFGN